MLTRRHLVQLIVAAAGTGLLPVAASKVAAMSDVSELGAQLSQPELLALLGRQCSAALPADIATLTRLAGLAALDSRQPQALLDAFAAQRQRDFRTGRVHLIDGWLMAEAECALCALLARS